MIALDASALLAYLFRETGHEIVATCLVDSCLSTVNLAEVLGRFARDGHDPIAVLDRIRKAGIEIASFDADQSVLAAALLPLTLSSGLSLGDRACLALAFSRKISAVTADRSWADLDIGTDIRLIR